MSSIICPRCGSTVALRRLFNPANKPFCSRCGWNLDRAEAALSAKNNVFKILPAGIAVAGMFVAFAVSRSHSAVPLIPLILFVSIILAFILALFWGLYSARRAVATAKLTANPNLAIEPTPAPSAFQMLQSIPRPRRVRFRIPGSLAAVALIPMAGLALAFFFIAGTPAHHGDYPRDLDSLAMMLLPFLVMIAVLVILIVLPILREKRNLPLLRDGEMAFARVTSQQTVQQGKASYSRINYEFKTNTGQQMRDSSRDLTNSMFEDMTLAVFYDPLDPSKNVACCATYLKVVDPFR